MRNNIPVTLRKFLHEVNKSENLEFSVNEVRQISENLASQFSLPKEILPFVEDRILKNGSQTIPIRLYHPAPEKDLPLILYLHGGGHVCGSLETHDNLCRRLAKQCECVVIAIDYRLAPEHPYPAGIEDCTFVFKTINNFVSDLLINMERIFVAGDSAGGNLAITLTHNAKQQGDNKINGLILIYPSVDFTMQFDSIDRNGTGYLLTKKKMIWYFNQYFSESNKDRTKASPINFKHLDILPPTYIAVAEYDPLFDEGVAFATKLKSLDVYTELEIFKGMIHVFVQLEKLVPIQINKLLDSISKFIARI